jgi:hypothetical protein
MTSGAMLLLEEAPGVTARVWPLQPSVTTIGRSDDCDVVLADREVSRQHAQVRHEGDRYVLVDLGSKNGTFLNGVRVSSALRLADGDEVRIAPRFRLLFADSDATAVAGPLAGGIAIDASSRTVTVAGRALEPALPPQQFALLQLLAGDPHRVFTRDEIAERCYPDARGGVTDQAIDGIVRRLRARLSAVDPDGDYLVALRGHGFRLRR